MENKKLKSSVDRKREIVVLTIISPKVIGCCNGFIKLKGLKIVRRQGKNKVKASI